MQTNLVDKMRTIQLLPLGERFAPAPARNSRKLPRIGKPVGPGGIIFLGASENAR